MSEKSMRKDLTEGSVPKLLLTCAAPLFVSNALQAVYNIVDMIVVGQVIGGSGMSAVSTGGNILHLLTFVAMGFSSAGQVIIAREVGMRNNDAVKKTIGTLFTLLFAIALVISVGCYVFRDPLLQVVNTPAEAYQYGRDFRPGYVPEGALNGALPAGPWTAALPGLDRRHPSGGPGRLRAAGIHPYRSGCHALWYVCGDCDSSGQTGKAGDGRGAAGPGVQQLPGLGAPPAEHFPRHRHRHQHRCGGRYCRDSVSHSGGRGMNIYVYIAAMAITTYLIRMLPLTIFRKPIKSRFLRSFLYYVPYAC